MTIPNDRIELQRIIVVERFMMERLTYESPVEGLLLRHTQIESLQIRKATGTATTELAPSSLRRALSSHLIHQNILLRKV